MCVTMTSDYNRDIFVGDQTWKDRPLEYWGIDLEIFEPRYVFLHATGCEAEHGEHSRAKKLLSLAKSVSSKVFVARSILDDLVCANSKVVLVGDAAHPISVRTPKNMVTHFMLRAPFFIVAWR